MILRVSLSIGHPYDAQGPWLAHDPSLCDTHKPPKSEDVRIAAAEHLAQDDGTPVLR